MMIALLILNNFINYKPCANLQLMADVRNVDRKMKVQTEENFQKTILNEINNLKDVMEQNSWF